MASLESPANPTVKNITLKGGAAEDYLKHKGGLRKKRSSTRKQTGGDSAPGPEIPLTQVNMNSVKRITNAMKGGASASTAAPVESAYRTTPLSDAPVMGVNANPATVAVGHVARNPESLSALPAVKAQLGAGTNPPTTAPATGGGKVILAPKKTKSSLLLAPPTAGKKKFKSIKQTRKVKVALSSMKKKLSTAKVIHKDSKEKSIAEIRRLLEEAKLVKPAKEGKQVPEDILRSIYKDYLILRNKAL